MRLYSVFTSDDLQHAGPYRDKRVAELVLKIFQMKLDEESYIWEVTQDPYAEELKAGLRPWKITIYCEQGQITGKPEIELCWPPEPQEGAIQENDWLKIYFVWAKTQAEALLRIPQLKKIQVQKIEKVEA